MSAEWQMSPWTAFPGPPASVSNDLLMPFPWHRSSWGEKGVLQEGLWPVLWLGPAEGPQNDKGRGGRHEAEDDRHLWEAFVADSGEHQRHHPAGRGRLLPRVLRLSPALAADGAPKGQTLSSASHSPLLWCRRETNSCKFALLINVYMCNYRLAGGKSVCC